MSGRIAPRTARVLRAWAAFGLALVAVVDARADVYGYVDDGGQLHLATSALDARYKLFMRSRDGTATLAAPPPRDADPALTRTRLFKRLVDHPNIAKYEPLIRQAAQKRGIDPELVKAVIAVESGFDPAAVSDKGAVGLMQVLPATGERYGVRGDAKRTVDRKLADPRLNVEIGTRYLADLLAMFPGRLDLALAAYNAGEGAVTSRRNTIPPFAETQAYVRLVDQFHTFYRPEAPRPEPASRIRVTLPGRRNLPGAMPPLSTTPPPSTTPAPPLDASLTDPPPIPDR